MLYFLYSLTADLESFNRVARKFILFFELPFLKITFLLSGAQFAVPRNSVYDSTHFNVFMSDLDFTIVCSEDQFDHLYKVSKALRKIFRNLGEIELYTLSEWTEIKGMESSSHWPTWTNIYLIRKASWQKKKLDLASGRYEKTKQERGLKITLLKLGFSSFPIDGIMIFSQLKDRKITKIISLPKFSKYLEHDLSIGKKSNDGIYFENENLAASFMSILPDNDCMPDDQELLHAKKLIIRREYLLAMTSLRLKILEHPHEDFAELINWLKDLEQRANLLG